MRPITGLWETLPESGAKPISIKKCEDIERKIIKDWGCFVGEGSGYTIVEGSEVDIQKMIQPYTPFCQFSTHPIASFDQINEVVQSMTGQ